jgi:hypothetical protein
LDWVSTSCRLIVATLIPAAAAENAWAGKMRRHKKLIIKADLTDWVNFIISP